MANHFRYHLAARPELIEQLNAIIPPPIEEAPPISTQSAKPKKTVRFFDEAVTQPDNEHNSNSINVTINNITG